TTHVSPRPIERSGARPDRRPSVVPSCQDAPMAVPPGESRCLDAVLQNPRVRDVLTRADALDLPDWYLAAGCLFQTVWNVLDGRDPEHGINDYDLIYHDDCDLSWDAEDVVIRR